jgi:hypothetical protein
MATDENDSVGSCNAPVKAVFNTPERIDQIVDALSLPVIKLSNDQASQLKALVTDFPDIFALNDAELGCTDLIKHSVDTGDHAPIDKVATVSYANSLACPHI